jgi:hypothetical protein
MKGTLAFVGVALLTMSSVEGEVPRAGSQSSEIRRVMSQRGTPLHQFPKTGERELVVEKDQSPPMVVGAGPGASELEWYASLAEVVLLVRVTRVDSSLSQGADWISSVVSADVLEVLEEPAETGESYSGKLVRFEQDGGEMDLNGARVRAVLRWASGFEVGKTYMVFGGAVGDSRAFKVTQEISFEIDESSTLRPLAHRGAVRREMGVPLSVAAERIRSAAQK